MDAKDLIEKQQKIIDIYKNQVEILKQIDENNQTIIEDLKKASMLRDEIIIAQQLTIDELRS